MASYSVLCYAQVQAESPEEAVRAVNWAIRNNDQSQLEYFAAGHDAFEVSVASAEQS